MEDDKLFRNIEEENEGEDLPWLDSPAMPKSEAGALQNKSFPLHVKTLRERYKKFKNNSAPLLISKSFKSVEKFRIEETYTIERTLGTGTYGVVKLARSNQTDELVAIKIAKGNTSIQMLENEARILKEIESEFFPKFINFHLDVASTKGYLIMEYVTGWNITEILEKSEVKLNSNTILHQLAQAVKLLHEKGIWHRDIKPDNVMLTENGRIKLIDFNISKKSKKKYDKDSITGTRFFYKYFTQVSTPIFAAPELSSLDWYTESIDIWGIGIIYACILFGESVMTHLKSNKLEFFQKITNESDRLNDYEIEVLSQLLNPLPENRPTAEELDRLLAEVCLL